MKWLDDKIVKAVEKFTEKLTETVSLKVTGYDEEFKRLKEEDHALLRVTNEIFDAIRSLQKEVLCVKADIENNVKLLNHKLNEKERLIREDVELGFTGLTRNLDKKLELLGDKRGIVTELLKRNAKLEGLAEEKNVHR